MVVLGLFLYDCLAIDFQYLSSFPDKSVSLEKIRKIFGIILVVQGFEISRYIGHKYSPELRIRTMRFAQIISSIIYLSFIFLVLFIMPPNQQATETAIISISQKVSIILPFAITIGGIFSQFSAAIADTMGCGGIIVEYTKKWISLNAVYILTTACAIFLIWTTNVFEIIAFASRAFAAYYFVQCLEALYINYLYRTKGKIWTIFVILLAILTALISLFGISAG